MSTLEPPPGIHQPVAQLHEEPPKDTAQPGPPEPGFRDVLSKFGAAEWLILVMLVALFGNMFVDMYKLWSIADAAQSYGMLILPASIALAWMLRLRLRNAPVAPAASGLWLVAGGLMLLLLGTLAQAITVSGLAFGCVITGVILARFGYTVTKTLWFPLAYLLTMVPIPSEMLNLMTFPLQKISIKWASLMLSPFGEIKVEGTQVHFGSFALNVIAPCSGLTILLPLLVLAAFYLYIVTSPLWKRAIVGALVVPIAMLVNAIRVALIAVVGDSWGQHAADSFHDYSGLITVVMGFVVMILIAREMRCDQIAEDIVV